ncbi:MAG: hypothetical protein M3P08_18810 [Thermoproteota archaeon]|jgi:hypothetical protein|nr:hypothetical protein [Thermoproteota archaeon]
MSVVLYIGGVGMVSINAVSNEQNFDSVLPTFNTMLHSLSFTGTGTETGTGTVAPPNSNNPNVLH